MRRGSVPRTSLSARRRSLRPDKAPIYKKAPDTRVSTRSCRIRLSLRSLRAPPSRAFLVHARSACQALCAWLPAGGNCATLRAAPYTPAESTKKRSYAPACDLCGHPLGLVADKAGESKGKGCARLRRPCFPPPCPLCAQFPRPCRAQKKRNAAIKISVCDYAPATRRKLCVAGA